MRRKFHLLLIISLVAFKIQAQSDEVRAKASFLEAQEEYSDGNFLSSIEKLGKIKSFIGGTNPRVENLLALSYYESGTNPIKAQEALNKYFELAADNDPNYSEMLLLIKKIDEQVATERAEKKRNEDAQRLERDRINLRATAGNVWKYQFELGNEIVYKGSYGQLIKFEILEEIPKGSFKEYLIRVGFSEFQESAAAQMDVVLFDESLEFILSEGGFVSKIIDGNEVVERLERKLDDIDYRELAAAEKKYAKLSNKTFKESGMTSYLGSRKASLIEDQFRDQFSLFFSTDALKGRIQSFFIQLPRFLVPDEFENPVNPLEKLSFDFMRDGKIRLTRTVDNGTGLVQYLIQDLDITRNILTSSQSGMSWKIGTPSMGVLFSFESSNY